MPFERVKTILLLFMALIIAGCIEDIALNDPGDLAGTNTGYSSPFPTATPTTDLGYGSTVPPTTTGSPSYAPSSSLSKVLAEWDMWLVIQTELDTQITQTVNNNDELGGRVIFLRDGEAAYRYENLLDQADTMTKSFTDWMDTMVSLARQKDRFDEARSELRYDIFVSSDADKYAAGMSSKMGDYYFYINSARDNIISSCSYQKAYIQSIKNGQRDRTLWDATNSELEKARRYLQAATDVWAEACSVGLQLGAMK